MHTLAAYLRETGADVVTLRAGFAPERIDEIAPDLVVLSPGPGTPADFGVADTIGAALARGLPLFGVCLGLQGIVEYFGGRLGTLGYPMHGKPSAIRWRGGRLLSGPAGALRGGALPLPVRGAGDPARVPRGDRGHRRRRHHGHRAPHPSGRGRAVPPGVDPDPRGRGRPAPHPRGGGTAPPGAVSRRPPPRSRLRHKGSTMISQCHRAR